MFDTRISILGGVLDTGIPQKERQHGPLGLVEWSVIGPFVRSTWGGGGGGGEAGDWRGPAGRA